MRFGELYESPRIVSDTDFGLSSPIKNMGLAQEFIKRKTTPLKDTKNYDLFYSKHNNDDYIVAIEKKTSMVVFLVQLKKGHNAILGKTVTQVALWRDVLAFYTRGLTNEVFFDIILKNTNAIISDSHHTTSGMDFWIARMAEANDLGFLVGYLNDINGEIEWYNQSMSGAFRTWVHHNRDKWSPEPKSRLDRFVISNP